jgi:hypothetical protein
MITVVGMNEGGNGINCGNEGIKAPRFATGFATNVPRVWMFGPGACDGAGNATAGRAIAT